MGVMIVLVLTDVVQIGALSDNVGSIDASAPFGSRVKNVLKDNPQALNDLTKYVLPSLAPQIFPENKAEFDPKSLTASTKGTAISNIEGVEGPLYFAHLATQDGKEATVVA